MENHPSSIFCKEKEMDVWSRESFVFQCQEGENLLKILILRIKGSCGYNE